MDFNTTSNKKPYQSNLIWFIGLSAVLIIIRFATEYDGFYGQDSYGYYQHAEGWLLFFKGGPKPIMHPSQPYLFPAFGALIVRVTHLPLGVTLQFLGFLSLIIAAESLYKVVDRLWEGNCTMVLIYVMIGFALTPYVLRQSFLVMSDMPCLAILVISIRFAFDFLNNGKAKYAVLAIFCGITASMFRYGAAILITPMCVLLCLKLLRTKKVLPVLIILVLTLVVVTPYFWVHSDNPAGFSNHSLLSGWHFSNLFSSTHTMEHAGTYEYSFPNAVFLVLMLFHPGLFVIGLVLLFFVRPISVKKNHGLLALFIGLLVYLIFNAGMPFQNKRFFILSLPFLLILFASSFDRAWDWGLNKFGGRVVFTLVGGVIIFQCCLGAYSLKKMYDINVIEKELSAKVNNYKANTVYTFGMDLPLRHYVPKHHYITLYEKETLPFNDGEMVLFNSEAILTNWSERAPGKLWRHLLDNDRLVVLWEHKSGWKLYELK